jgi:hypothetical protein
MRSKTGDSEANTQINVELRKLGQSNYMYYWVWVRWTHVLSDLTVEQRIDRLRTIGSRIASAKLLGATFTIDTKMFYEACKEYADELELIAERTPTHRTTTAGAE